MMLMVVAAWGLIFGGIGYLSGESRGRGFAGVLLGLFVGPLGWLIAAFLPRTPEAEAAHQRRVRDAQRRIGG